MQRNSQSCVKIPGVPQTLPARSPWNKCTEAEHENQTMIGSGKTVERANGFGWMGPFRPFNLEVSLFPNRQLNKDLC